MSKKYAKKASRSRRKPSKDLNSYAATLDEEGRSFSLLCQLRRFSPTLGLVFRRSATRPVSWS